METKHDKNVLALEVEPWRKLWFTSDLHFGHRRMVPGPDSFEQLRPYADVEEMDKAIIDTWNSTVSDDDVVVFLGDFIMNCPKADLLSRFYGLMDKLKGRIFMVVGNHDHILRKVMHGYKSYEYARIAHGNRTFVCQHHPFSVDSGFALPYLEHSGLVDELCLVHGHEHFSKPIGSFDGYVTNNVCFDNEYKLYSSDKLATVM